MKKVNFTQVIEAQKPTAEVANYVRLVSSRLVLIATYLTAFATLGPFGVGLVALTRLTIRALIKAILNRKNKD